MKSSTAPSGGPFSSSSSVSAESGILGAPTIRTRLAGAQPHLISAVNSLNSGVPATPSRSKRTVSVLVSVAPAFSHRRSPTARFPSERESTASSATNTENPPRNRSRTVWKTQTCASIPTTTTCLRPLPSTWRAIGLDAPQENSIFLIGSCGRSSRSEDTVGPRPLGYCSVAITGISRRRAARISTAAFLSSSASGAFGIAAASFSCTSITISSASARSSASAEALPSDCIALRAARRGRLRVEDDVHARHRPRCQRALQRGPDLRRLGHVLAVSAQRFHHLVVAGRRELRGRRLFRPEELHLRQPDLAPGGVVSDHHHHGQLEAERGLVVHAVESERAVALDHEHRPVRMQELRGDGEWGAHAGAPLGSGIGPAPGLAQARELARSGTQ